MSSPDPRFDESSVLPEDILSDEVFEEEIEKIEREKEDDAENVMRESLLNRESLLDVFSFENVLKIVGDETQRLYGINPYKNTEDERLRKEILAL